MALLRRCFDKLHLKINKSKSAVASVFGRKFLGFALWQAGHGEVRRAVSEQSLEAFRQRVRQLTRRNGGRSMAEVIERLRSYVLGLKGYFGLAQTPRIWRRLDEWIRRRLRALQLKQWRRGKTIYRELIRLGASARVAQSVAALSRSWWYNSLSAVHHVLTIAYFDRLGLPHLSWHQLLEPPGADPHAEWCGRGTVNNVDLPYADLHQCADRRWGLCAGGWRDRLALVKDAFVAACADVFVQGGKDFRNGLGLGAEHILIPNLLDVASAA